MGASGDRPVIDVYARISRLADTGEMIKVDDQVELCSEKVGERGGEVGEVFRDPSLSAWKPGVVRPPWDALMSRLERGESDGVCVYDLTRWTRKVLEGERLVELAGRGVRVWSLAGEYDLTTADGRRHFREAIVGAAAESDKISERSSRGKRRKALRGRVPSPGRAFGMPGFTPRAPGWERGDPREMVSEDQVAAERAIIRECYERVFSGEPVESLVSDLYRRGVRTVNGKLWTSSTLRGTLMRPSVAGLSSYKGEVLGELVGVEPIVTREEWERLIAIMAGRRRGRPYVKLHLLSGLVRCGACGKMIHGFVRSNVRPYADGTMVRQYRCRRARPVASATHGCGRNYIDGRYAEWVVGEAVKERLGDPRRVERITKHLSSVREKRLRIESEIAMLNEKADVIAVKSAEWTMERVEKAMGPILRRIAELREQLTMLNEPEGREAAYIEATKTWDEALAIGEDGVDTLRAMIRQAFPRLTIRPHTRPGDNTPDRFDWDGLTLPDNQR